MYRTGISFLLASARQKLTIVASQEAVSILRRHSTTRPFFRLFQSDVHVTVKACEEA